MGRCSKMCHDWILDFNLPTHYCWSLPKSENFCEAVMIFDVLMKIAPNFANIFRKNVFYCIFAVTIDAGICWCYREKHPCRGHNIRLLILSFSSWHTWQFHYRQFFLMGGISDKVKFAMVEKCPYVSALTVGIFFSFLKPLNSMLMVSWSLAHFT